MKQVERCLEAMKKGLPWSKIKDDFPGGSTRYEALSKYFPWAEKRYLSLQQKITSQDSKLADLKARKEEASSRMTKLNDEADVLTDRVVQQKTLLEELSAEESDLRDRVDTLKDQFQELAERGVTEATLERMSRIDFEDDEDLLSRIASLEKYQALCEETSNLSNLKVALLGEIEELEHNKESLQKETSSVKNLLDESKRRYYMWEQALAIVVSFFQGGYNSELLRGLKEALDALAITGEPKRSIERLLNAIVLNRDLGEIESMIRQETARLRTIRGEIDEAEGTLRAIRDSALVEIKRTYEEGLGLLFQASKEIEKGFQRQSQDAHNMLENLEQGGLSHMRTFSLRLQNSLEFYEGQIRRWGEDRQEAGRYQTVIQQGLLLFGILEDERAILGLGPRVVSQVAERLHIYASVKFPDTKTRAPKNVADKEYAILETWDVALTSVTYWLKEAFKNLLRGAQA